MTDTQEITLWLADPRGFFSFFRRAINLVEQALKTCPPPVYARHELVHNRHVIDDLKAKGAVFVEDLSVVPDGSTLIFSAHGVGKEIISQAAAKHLHTIDATCPLVEKVHQQIIKYAEQNIDIIVIGKASHPEIIGTIGQIPGYKKLHVINSVEEAQKINIPAENPVGFVSQTTLSVDETSEIISVLKRRFPNLQGLAKKYICYATTNRQQAVKALASRAECIIILGSQNSSNSRQLKETALRNGARAAFLIDDSTELDWSAIAAYQNFGISAGASAPEYLIKKLLDDFRSRYHKINIRDVIVAEENVNFKP